MMNIDRGGKTTFAFNLLYHKHFTKPIKHVHYFGVVGGEELDWHEQLPDMDITYHGIYCLIVPLPMYFI